MATLEELSSAFEKLREDGFDAFCYLFKDGEVHLTLNKHNYSGTKIAVEGKGNSVAEALEAALANFPKNPLDGSKWINSRLPPPSDVVEGKFDEIPF